MRDTNLAHHEQQLAWALQHIGVTTYHTGVSWPVFEDDYMKFMGGPEWDVEACNQFCVWLSKQGFTFERHRDRAVRSIDPRAVALIHKLWKVPEDEDERCSEHIEDPDAQRLVEQVEFPATHVWTSPAA